MIYAGGRRCIALNGRPTINKIGRLRLTSNSLRSSAVRLLSSSYLHSHRGSIRPPVVQGHANYATAAVSSKNGLGIQDGDRDSPKSVAILGGGLAGLSTAYYLSVFAPHIKITLYEAADRLGGWIDTERVRVPAVDASGQWGTVLFERAARMIKPNSLTSGKIDDMVLYDLICRLSLVEQARVNLAPLPKYMYYPDHLVRLRPGAALTEPLFTGVFPSLFHSIMGQRAIRRLCESVPDVSIGDYFTAVFGRRDLVDNLLSALMHGTSGGDVYKQSMASGIFGRIWAEKRIPVPGLLRRSQTSFMWRHDLEMVADMDPASASYRVHGVEGGIQLMRLARSARTSQGGALWFKDGFSTLTDAMAADLRSNPNVTIKTEEAATSVRYSEEDDQVAIITSKQKQPATYDKVVSTILANKLASLAGNDRLPALADEEAVTIQLVNLWYPTEGLNRPDHYGFGYLIPQSVGFDQNPEGALGVIFDSDREAGVSGDTVPGTKFTVMLGGHLWKDMPKGWWPDAKAAADMAKAVLTRHLGIPEAEHEKAVVSTKVCRECIPQHLVGHEARMREAHAQLEEVFKGRLAVAGGSYHPPGVTGSLRAGRDVAAQVAGRIRAGGRTGLETFVHREYTRIELMDLVGMTTGDKMGGSKTGDEVMEKYADQFEEYPLQ